MMNFMKICSKIKLGLIKAMVALNNIFQHLIIALVLAAFAFAFDTTTRLAASESNDQNIMAILLEMKEDIKYLKRRNNE